MHEKSKLVQSMGNLINHINKSRQHQQQIFHTFCKEDLRKIISNLEDSSQKVRSITLKMLTQLLFNNTKLQAQFCYIMNIGYQHGKIVLTYKFPREAVLNPVTIRQIYKLLRSDITPSDIDSLFWYIDPSAKPMKVVYVKDRAVTVDSSSCIIGIFLLQNQLDNSLKNSTQNQATSSTRKGDDNATRVRGKSYLKRKSEHKYPINGRLYKTQRFDVQTPPHQLSDRVSQFFKATGRKNDYDNLSQAAIKNNVTFQRLTNSQHMQQGQHRQKRQNVYNRQFSQQKQRQIYVRPPPAYQNYTNNNMNPNHGYLNSSQANRITMPAQNKHLEYQTMNPAMYTTNPVLSQSLSIGAPFRYIKTDNLNYGVYASTRHSFPITANINTSINANNTMNKHANNNEYINNTNEMQQSQGRTVIRGLGHNLRR